jgi:hypothetical protein
MLLDLNRPERPILVTTEPAGDVVWSPDHTQIAYTAARPYNGRTVATIHTKPLAGQEPVDVLPGDLAMKSVSTGKEIHGWFDPTTLAYHEHMGASVQQLFLDNPEKGELLPTESLMASSFIWSEYGQRVAGQMSGGPAHFWLWDREQKRFRTPKVLPGVYQWFEAWAPDGRTAMAYVQFAPKLTLVVTRARDGAVAWSDDLGERSKIEAKPWEYRPAIATTFVGYRTADDEWRVSPIHRKESRVLFAGPADAAQWSPFGRYLAVSRPVGQGVRLQVLENPLTVGNPVPIEEALRVAYAAAKQTHASVELLRGFNQQTYEEREAAPPPGIDGRLRAWAFEFVDPSKQDLIIVQTWDGKVASIDSAGSDTGRSFDPSTFKVTGGRLATQAKKAGIEPGTGGVAGYGYQFAFDDGRKRYTLTLRGYDEQRDGKRLVVDPTSGESLPAIKAPNISTEPRCLHAVPDIAVRIFMQ